MTAVKQTYDEACSTDSKVPCLSMESYMALSAGFFGIQMHTQQSISTHVILKPSPAVCDQTVFISIVLLKVDSNCQEPLNKNKDLQKEREGSLPWRLVAWLFADLISCATSRSWTNLHGSLEPASMAATHGPTSRLRRGQIVKWRGQAVNHRGTNRKGNDADQLRTWN